MFCDCTFLFPRLYFFLRDCTLTVPKVHVQADEFDLYYPGSRVHLANLMKRMEPVTKPRTVVLYGNSLLMASLGATLRRREDLNLEYIQVGGREGAMELRALRPDVVLFDLTTARPDFMLSLFPTRPQARLIGVDPDGRRLLVLTGREFQGLAVSDLLGAILETTASPEQGGEMKD